MQQTIGNALWRRSFGALVCMLLAVSMMNIAVFPMFDVVCDYAREVSTFANCIACMVLGATSLIRPGALQGRALNIASMVALLASAVITPWAMALNSLPFLLAACILAGSARAWVIIVVGMATARMDLKQTGTCVTAAFFAYYVLTLVAWVVPSYVSLVLFLLLPPLALVLSAGDAASTLEASASAEPPLELAATQPNTFLPLGSQVFTCLFLFRICFGFALRFGETAGVPQMDFWAVVIILVIAVYMVLSKKNFPADQLVALACVLAVAGFYATATASEVAPQLSVTLLSAGSTCFDLVSWIVLLGIAHRNRYGAVALFAWGHSLMALGSIIGARLAVVANTYAYNEVAFIILNGFFIIGFCAYALFGLHGFSFTQTINDVQKAMVHMPDLAEEMPTVANGHKQQASQPAPALEIGDEQEDRGRNSAMACEEDDTLDDSAPSDRVEPEAPEAPTPHGDSPRPTAAEPVDTVERARKIALQALAGRCDSIARRCSLTPREREVLGMLARGYNSTRIEGELVVSRNTVKAHVKHIYTKLDIHSHQDLIALIEAEDGTHTA